VGLNRRLCNEILKQGRIIRNINIKIQYDQLNKDLKIKAQAM
jgi:hypothetical protein